MYYKFLMRSKMFPNIEMDRCKISKWEMVLGAPD